MLHLAILAFALAAVFGAYLLTYILRNKETPKTIVFLHGPLASLGLILLIIYACFNSPSPILSIVLFVLAAMGGLTMLYKYVSKQSIPKWLAIGHGVTALIAFILLIVFIYYNA